MLMSEKVINLQGMLTQTLNVSDDHLSYINTSLSIVLNNTLLCDKLQ